MSIEAFGRWFIMKTTLKYALKSIIAGILVFSLAVISGILCYEQGQKDGRHLAGRELSAMTYLKSKSDVDYGESDPWLMVEKYKNEKPADLPWYLCFIGPIRKSVYIASDNYASAFNNGEAPTKSAIRGR